MENIFGLDLTREQVELLKSTGFPTFDEFVKNPDNYRKTQNDIFETIENGPEVLRSLTKGKHVLKVAGKKVDSVGQMIRIAKDMGFNLKQMTFTVNLEAVGDGKYIHHIDLVPKPKVEGI